MKKKNKKRRVVKSSGTDFEVEWVWGGRDRDMAKGVLYDTACVII